jgi:hypothetical protein
MSEYGLHQLCATEILHAAHDCICELAEDVGIDGRRLMTRLPCHGEMLKGTAVPVVSSAYRYTCSVLLYVNWTVMGNWPFIRLHTFKHGGVERNFNGLRWILGQRSPRHCFDPTVLRPRIALRPINNEGAATAQRLARFNALVSQYSQGAPLECGHPWLEYRLCGWATSALMVRVGLRSNTSGELLVPINHVTQGVIGFHRIISDHRGDLKHHFVRAAGLLRGSYIRIAAESDRLAGNLPVVLCEGLATGLSLALVWLGEIHVALSANNLAAVRHNTGRAVLFCHDQDVWKQNTGNVGLDAAESALTAEDRLCGPVCETASLSAEPTDFNDLLRLEGVAVLRTQLEGVCPEAFI